MSPQELKLMIALVKDAQSRVQGGLLDIKMFKGEEVIQSYVEPKELMGLLKSLRHALLEDKLSQPFKDKQK